MRPNCCHVSLAFALKFLSFLQAFIGVSIILYSIWMLDQWSHRSPVPPRPPPPPYPSPSPAAAAAAAYSHLLLLPDPRSHFSPRSFKHIAHVVSEFHDGLLLDLDSFELPAPWFIYSFMGAGIILCCITLIGCIAAEAINGFCLCFYTILKTVLILLEVALVAFIVIDRRWEEDLPFDPTGEIQSLRSFIEDNADICKWVGISVIIIQALSLLLAMVLRAMVSTRRTDFDEDDYENVRGRTWEPLLNQSGQTSGGSGTHSDIWSSRMREKYGLNSSEKSNLLNQNASVIMKSK